MGVKKGLSIDGIKYFSDVITGNKNPSWLDFAPQIAKLTGNYTILNLATGLKGLENFLFKTHNWLIGGVHFDGIMRTEHTGRVRTTTYPVQTGVTMSEHSIIEPSELVIDVMVSDCYTKSFTTHNPFLDIAYNIIKHYRTHSNTPPVPTQDANGAGRSINAWSTLKLLQQSRVPIKVITRLQTYNNMIIEELSAPDDVKTLNALKATVRLKEIIVAQTAQTVVSARATLTETTTGGQLPVNTNINDTALNAISKAIGASG